MMEDFIRIEILQFLLTYLTHGLMDSWTHGLMDSWTHGLKQSTPLLNL